MPLKYSEKKKVEGKKWLFKLTMQQSLENNPQILLSHFLMSCIPSNSTSVLYNTVNVDLCCKHPGLEVISSTQRSWSHASPRTPGEWSRAQHVELKEFTAPPHIWFTIVEIEGDIGREMEKYRELEAVQYLLWKQVQPISCETGQCLTSSFTWVLKREWPIN